MKKRLILLVEDSDDDALLFTRVVSKTGLGIETHRVRNGQEGIDYLLGAGGFSTFSLKSTTLTSSLDAESASSTTRNPPEGLATTVPMGRLGITEELANAIVFIASDEASFINGHILNVDGGKSH